MRNILVGVGLGLAVVSATQAGAEENAQLIEVLLSAQTGGATPVQVMEYLASVPRTGPPPIPGSGLQDASGAYYLLPIRATGDFLALLSANPDSARAKLERYIVVSYPSHADTQGALAALRSASVVEAAYLQSPAELSSVSLVDFGIGTGPGPVPPIGYPQQYGWDALNIAGAWAHAGGYALVGVADIGLATEHPALMQFNAANQYLGGNFISAASLDIGDWPTDYDDNVDEAEAVPLPPGPPCNVENLPAVEPFYVGHGTHVAGLIAANSGSESNVNGTCRHCGIAMWKIAFGKCAQNSGYVIPTVNNDAVPAALTFMGDTGVQVASLSIGQPTLDPLDFCPENPDFSWCLALTQLESRDVIVTAASGNYRTNLQFPASDARTLAVGGFDQSLQLWDESPNNYNNCPYAHPPYPPDNDAECGSNYTLDDDEPRQDLVASSKSVLSTFYPEKNWNPDIECGDDYGTPPDDGVGLCTGTSMSAPQIAGVAGILRSINPLVGVEETKAGAAGIRNVLQTTTFEALASQPWTYELGYGHPNAAAAAQRMLGEVAGRTVKNRVTPLFHLYSSAAQDYADVGTPQYAIALVINQANAYLPQGSTIPGYTEFASEFTTPAPRADVYVLTTEYQPRTEWPNLVPLYLMDRSFGGGNRDFMLVTTKAHLEFAYGDGYDLRNIQGYIYERCTPEPACMPPGTQKFYRACNTAKHDCASFLQEDFGTFEDNDYTVPYPPGSDTVLGYAYPSMDTDGDGLVDGFEYVIGTAPQAGMGDTDGDGKTDAEEFPMTAVSDRDPCGGGTFGVTRCPADVIFDDGFE